MHQPQHPQMMQQNGPPSAAPSPLKAVTTEEIQKCLDENKNLILAILENQSQGKLAECAQYQAILQKNLTYLAAVADAQPPPSTPMQPQVSGTQPAISIQQAGPVQQQQQQQGASGPRLPFQLNSNPSQDPHYQLMQYQQQQQQQQHQQQQQQQHQQQQQQLQGHINLGPGGVNGMHQMMHPSMGAALGTSLMDMRGANNKQTFDRGSGNVQGKSGLGGGK